MNIAVLCAILRNEQSRLHVAEQANEEPSVEHKGRGHQQVECCQLTSRDIDVRRGRQHGHRKKARDSKASQCEVVHEEAHADEE